jgi:acetylornithine deacetylase
MNSAQILERLVGFPTVSRDSNLSLIEYAREFLTACGATTRIYMDVDARKANLYASVGPAEQPGILLSGHTDVVPVDGQTWSTPCFELRQRDQRLYARGAADMKGFLACALRAARRAAGMQLQMPLQLAFSYDEEVGCLGVRSLIEDMARWTERPRCCIVGEPTLLRPAVGHKGKTAFTAVCHGRAAHSANPALGVNAIHMAADLIERIRARQERIVESGPRDSTYEVPYTTLHVGVIRGGTVLNIVPSRCELEFEFRNIPGDDPTALLGELRADVAAVARSSEDAAGTGIELRIEHDYPALDTPPDADVVELAAALTGHRQRIKVGYGSEAGLFSGRLGIPTVVCGPGSIDQAHKPDEFIALDQLEACDAMMDALLQRLI